MRSGPPRIIFWLIQSHLIRDFNYICKISQPSQEGLWSVSAKHIGRQRWGRRQKNGEADAEQGGLLSQLCPVLMAPVCPLLAGPRRGLAWELLAGGGAMLGCAHPGHQVHVALQLLARQGPRRWSHLPCLTDCLEFSIIYNICIFIWCIW